MKTKALLLSSLVGLVGLVGCVNSKKPASQDAGTAPPAVSQATPSTANVNSNAFTVEQCESLLVDAERKLADARSRAQTTCKKDDDCKLIEMSACIPACVNRSIARMAVEPYMKEREMLRQTSCKLWNDAECPRTTPKPTPQCPEMKAICRAGRCDVAPK